MLAWNTGVKYIMTLNINNFLISVQTATKKKKKKKKIKKKKKKKKKKRKREEKKKNHFTQACITEIYWFWYSLIYLYSGLGN